MTELNIEEGVMQALSKGIEKVIQSTLEGYNSPLAPIIEAVIKKHSDKIKSILDTEVEKSLNSKDFKKAIQEAIHHKVARIIISKMEGTLEKTVNDLRNSPEFKAKLTLAVTKIVSELEKK